MDERKATPSNKRTALEAIQAEFKGTDHRSQCSRLLEALARFPVTTFEAMRLLDVYRFPTRVLQLRKEGHKVTKHWQKVETEGSAKHRVDLCAKEIA